MAMWSHGLVVATAGVGLLRLSWALRRSAAAAYRWPLVGVGWYLIAAAAYLWAQSAGTARGIALTCLAVAVLGLGATLPSILVRRRREAVRARGGMARNGTPSAADASRADTPCPQRWRRGLSVFIAAGPAAGAVALGLAVPLYALLDAPWLGAADRLAAVLFFVPIAWSAFAVAALSALQGKP